MQALELAAVPNQQFTVTLDGVRYSLAFQAANGVMAASIERDGVPVVTGQRIVAGEPIIPYRYLAPDGNFIIATADNELPDWTRFGNSQTLLYASAAELYG